jgi:hypothetical protein
MTTQLLVAAALWAALAWRDTMVSNYSDAGQERWLEHGIDLLRGRGRLAGTGVVDVDGVRHTALAAPSARGAVLVIEAPYCGNS